MFFLQEILIVLPLIIIHFTLIALKAYFCEILGDEKAQVLKGISAMNQITSS